MLYTIFPIRAMMEMGNEELQEGTFEASAIRGLPANRPEIRPANFRTDEKTLTKAFPKATMNKDDALGNAVPANFNNADNGALSDMQMPLYLPTIMTSLLKSATWQTMCFLMCCWFSDNEASGTVRKRPPCASADLKGQMNGCPFSVDEESAVYLSGLAKREGNSFSPFNFSSMILRMIAV